MADPITECPYCRGPFLVPADAAADRMLCPHCRQVVDLSRWTVGLAAKPAKSNKPSDKTGSPNLGAIVTDCPSCSGKFQVLASMFGQSVACPHCRVQLQIAASTSAGPAASDLNIQIGGPPPASSSAPSIEAQFPKPKRRPPSGKPVTIQVPEKDPDNEVRTMSDAEAVTKPPQANATPIVASVASSGAIPSSGLDPELEKLLPPKFLVPGSLQRVAKSLGAAHVFLPDAQGGFQAVDTSVRQIQFAGQSVAISSMPESRKRFRRTIRSILMFTVCIAILFVAFYLLNR